MTKFLSVKIPFLQIKTVDFQKNLKMLTFSKNYYLQIILKNNII
ncbi:hypothetical protein AB996_1124 [Lactococcus cremoris]|uniref:Uncharacterized protein n=1 Tax=Lactococcus lactis subsp. cremoris TaxID=1359 RepID=A0A166JTJ9_LACLC|nr:hypothetical protein AB996_1124 [Lactococcus cremoris]